MMNVVVTWGPSFEPIDEVRRLTNFSTGQLGVMLAETLATAGFSVTCLKGSMATHPGPAAPCQVELFDTNDDLLQRLRRLAGSQTIGALFHVAALCDYRVKEVQDEAGRVCHSPKLASRSGALTLSLEPATKVIAQLRDLFPRSRLVGWKYELAGDFEQAMARAQRLLIECRTDACVLNGRAYGPGFAFCRPGQPAQPCADKGELVRLLAQWLAGEAR